MIKSELAFFSKWAYFGCNRLFDLSDTYFRRSMHRFEQWSCLHIRYGLRVLGQQEVYT